MKSSLKKRKYVENNSKVKKKIKFENITEEKECSDTCNFTLAEDILIDELETSSENLHEDIFWVKKLKMSDRDDVVNSNGWLNDRLINFAQNLLKSECNVNGLQDTLFAPHYDEKKNRWIINDYVKKQTAPSCQIHYNGNNHWICSYQKEENGPVYLLDSLKSSRTLNANVSIQISQIYNINTDNITVHIPDVQRQQNSHDCGVYAIAFITELICSDFNVDISNTRFMTSLMRTHLLKCIEENKISVFPKVAKMPKMPCNEPKITKIKLYCKCKMPEFIDDMIGCDNKHCRKWFHKKCIFNSTTSCNNSNDNWLCSSCCW